MTPKTFPESKINLVKRAYQGKIKKGKMDDDIYRDLAEV